MAAVAGRWNRSGTLHSPGRHYLQRVGRRLNHPRPPQYPAKTPLSTSGQSAAHFLASGVVTGGRVRIQLIAKVGHSAAPLTWSNSPALQCPDDTTPALLVLVPLAPPSRDPSQDAGPILFAYRLSPIFPRPVASSPQEVAMADGGMLARNGEGSMHEVISLSFPSLQSPLPLCRHFPLYNLHQLIIIPTIRPRSPTRNSAVPSLGLVERSTSTPGTTDTCASPTGHQRPRDTC